MSLAKDLAIYQAADQLLALSLRLQTQVPRAYRQAAENEALRTKLIAVAILPAALNQQQRKKLIAELRPEFEKVITP